MYLLQASLNWVIIGPGNGFVPNRHKAITWTNDDFLSIGPLGTYFSKVWVEVENNFYKNNTKDTMPLLHGVLSEPLKLQCLDYISSIDKDKNDI